MATGMGSSALSPASASSWISWRHPCGSSLMRRLATKTSVSSTIATSWCCSDQSMPQNIPNWTPLEARLFASRGRSHGAVMEGLKVRHPISRDVISVRAGLSFSKQSSRLAMQPEATPVRDSRDHHAGQYGQINRDGRRHGRSGHRAERAQSGIGWPVTSTAASTVAREWTVVGVASLA